MRRALGCHIPIEDRGGGLEERLMVMGNTANLQMFALDVENSLCAWRFTLGLFGKSGGVSGSWRLSNHE